MGAMYAKMSTVKLPRVKMSTVKSYLQNVNAPELDLTYLGITLRTSAVGTKIQRGMSGGVKKVDMVSFLSFWKSTL
jgi:hypothetical protein